MKVLVLGSGGREHALVWKIGQSPRVSRVYCAPGNAGIARDAECVALAVDDFEGLVAFVKESGIDLTVVGPEVPLTLGVVDFFQQRGLRIFGPAAAAARLEGSKIFTKDLMRKYNIPSAEYRTFTDMADAVAYIKEKGAPLVLKADGLAAGKGVILARTDAEALDAVNRIMGQREFGDAGERLLVEEFITGEEASFIAFTDGYTIMPLPSSQDHKAVFDGDKGPNTGGMGAYSPAPVVSERIHDLAMEQVMRPTVAAMAAEGCPYKGILYAGLMIDGERIRVLEFNCRLGDPEAQPLLMRLESDIVEIMEAVIDERLDQVVPVIDPRPTVCVVMASGGYPGRYEKGYEISGLEEVEAMDDVVVFHAGTGGKDGHLINTGGRVLGVTARGENLPRAIDNAYAAVKKISWENCYFRNDIGRKALSRIKGCAPRVAVLMGSDSDLPVMQGCFDNLVRLGLSYEVVLASAHRTPERAVTYAREAESRGVRVIIAAAGMAAHLAGAIAANTRLPVIGIPVDASPLNGLDALLSTVQMPPGVPVATVAIGSPGARNAAVLAARIIALGDKDIADRLDVFTGEMKAAVLERAEKLSGMGF